MPYVMMIFLHQIIQENKRKRGKLNSDSITKQLQRSVRFRHSVGNSR